MRHLFINKAGNVGIRSAPGFIIEASEPVPEFAGEGWAGHAAQRYEGDADALFSTLRDNLPGGTLDRLTVKLLQHQAGLLMVSYAALDRRPSTPVDTESTNSPIATPGGIDIHLPPTVIDGL